MQLAGSKVWDLRPNAAAEWPGGASLQEALALVARGGVSTEGGVSRVRVRCECGDLLLINTRLWFHATNIPCTVPVPAARDLTASQVELPPPPPSKAHKARAPASAAPEMVPPAAASMPPLSMSVARDFYLREGSSSAAGAEAAKGYWPSEVKGGEQARGEGGDGAEVDMTNVDASWALADISAEEEVLREEPLVAVQDGDVCVRACGSCACTALCLGAST